jgi:beta-lactamase regulating signal transducer with metallopeptidase domain
MITIEPDLVFTLGGAVMHFLWQGALIGLIAAVILHGLRKGSAQARYAVACGALAVCLVVFVATFIWLMPQTTDAQGVTSIISESLTATVQYRWNFAEIAAWGWGLGVVFMLLRFARHWLWSHRLRTRMVADPDGQWLQVFEELKQELGLSKAISLLKSGLAETPMVVGWFAPMVLVPASAFTSLSPEQMRMILAHELTHIRRYDHWVNQFQGVVEIILFFHPAMWWISRQVRIEREYCCDDASLRGTPDPKALAEALTQLELHRISSPPNALAANGGSLMDRITRILGNRVNQINKPKEQKMKFKTLGTLVAAVFLIGSLFIVQADDKKEGKDPRAEKFRAAEEKIWAAVKAGKVSKEDAQKKLTGLKKKIWGGDQKKDSGDKKKGSGDKKESYDKREAKFHAFEKEIWGAVKAGKLSKKEAEKKLVILKKEMFGDHDKKDWDARKKLGAGKAHVQSVLKATNCSACHVHKKDWDKMDWDKMDWGKLGLGWDKKDWDGKKDLDGKKGRDGKPASDIEVLKRQLEALKRENEGLRKRLEKRKDR